MRNAFLLLILLTAPACVSRRRFLQYGQSMYALGRAECQLDQIKRVLEDLRFKRALQPTPAPLLDDGDDD